MIEKRIWQIGVFILVLTLFCSSCGSSQQMDAESLEATADEFVRQLENLEDTAAVFAQQTNSVIPSLPPTQTIAPTITKKPTPKPIKFSIPTPSITVSPTPDTPAQARVIGDVNCRTGPSSSYDWVTLINAGQIVNIVGQDIQENHWVIQNPSGMGFCWIWSGFTTLIGTPESIPHLAAPPTKTPTRTATSTPKPTFSIKFETSILCNGQDAIVIRVYNSSRQPFRSWRAHVFNIPGRVSQTTVGENQFSHSSDECALTISNLGYRRTGYAIVPFDSSQANEFLIEFEACTEIGKRGACAFDGFTIKMPLP
jgi:hypothetical protein